MKSSEWTNWGRNQSFSPGEIIKPQTEQEAVDLIRAKLRDGKNIRVAGSGHSFTPIVETDGALFDLSGVSGVISIDSATRRAIVHAGSTIASLGEPLWNGDLSIANQGDVDVQSIAGAIATGTKGSGRAHGSISSAVTSVRFVNGLGEVIDIDAGEPEKLRSAQVSLGMLGPILRIGLQLVPAYRLREENVILPMSEVLRQWDYLLSEYRHFSFWWMPADRSADMYKLGDVPADHCFVKLLREIPAEAPDVPIGEVNSRTDRAYRIYPDGTTIAEFHELEYMVGSDDAWAAVDVMRYLMRSKFSDEISPLQVRWQKADEGHLSPQTRRDSVSLSVSGEIGRDYLPFLKAVDEALQPFAARPHWGKLHFLTKERVEALYPEYEKFQQFRKTMDPEGRFLNSHLEALFG